MKPYAGQNQPWTPADATDFIRQLTEQPYSLALRGHAPKQMSARGLIVGDVKYVLKAGFVYEDPVPSTRDGLFKYKMESDTPNSNSRVLRVVLVPCWEKLYIKIVTIMYRDEAVVGGSR